jgi:hypothetical protein
MWGPPGLTTLWASTVCYRDNFTFYLWNFYTTWRHTRKTFFTAGYSTIISVSKQYRVDYRIINECEGVGGMRIGRVNRSNRKKPAPVSLCPPYISRGITWDRTPAAAVGILPLTASVMARIPDDSTVYSHHRQRIRYSDRLRAGRPKGRSSSHGRVKNFLFSSSSRPALGSTQPPIHWVSGLFPRGVKRSGRKADHSPPTSTEVKKSGSTYTSMPTYAFMA